MSPRFAWISRYERQLSAASMVAGFVVDNFMFRRIDLPNTQLIFLAYLGGAAVSIALLHALSAHTAPDTTPPKWRAIFPMATQFALGGLWSGFLIFYTRSAVLLASWPFLLVLVAIFIGNEILKRYHERLVFTTVLFFFALFSYCIVTIPVFTRTVGAGTFLLSGGVAIAVFLVFLCLLDMMGHEQFRKTCWQIVGGAIAVYGLITGFWFANILPPLPIALARSGVFYSVQHTGNDYVGVGETVPWYRPSWLDTPVVHVPPGGALYLYSAVFAPVRFSTTIVHRWQLYDPHRHRWNAVSTVGYAINGGRDGGFRGYTVKRNVAPGAWRVDIALADGHLLGRQRFNVDNAVPTAATTQILN